jgi:hypothetical protein
MDMGYGPTIGPTEKTRQICRVGMRHINDYANSP